MTQISAGNGVPNKGASIVNSTVSPLGIAGTYTGEWEKSGGDQVMVSCITDQAGTLYFDFSNDASRVLTFPPFGFVVSAGVHKFQNAIKGGRYFRVRFVREDWLDRMGIYIKFQNMEDIK